MAGDEMMRGVGDGLPVPEFEAAAWATPKPLAEATVAIVTSAALHRSGDEGFQPGDTEYRLLPSDARDLVLGHWSPNFDRSGRQSAGRRCGDPNRLRSSCCCTTQG